MNDRTITISQLKAKLSAVLAKIRSGGRIVVLDRKEPIAELISFKNNPLRVVSEPKGSFQLPAIKGTECKIDPLALLLEERSKR